MTDGYELPPLSELVGEDLPEELRAEIERVDGLLRAVPALPELPPRLRTVAVPGEPRRAFWSRLRPAAAGLATVAAVAIGFFALGSWLGADGFDVQASVPMEGTAHAVDASGTLGVGAVDEAGNRTVRLDVSGLPELPEGAYYFLWLAREGEYAAPCGTFTVGAGTTTAQWTVSYDPGAFDEWVVTARLPDRPTSDAPWLLRASVDT